MCWYIWQTIGQRLCCLFDNILTGTVFLGGISTTTTISLQYTGYIDDWKAVVFPSIITFFAILGCVLRCVCKAQRQNSINTETIIISTTPHGRIPQVAKEINIPVNTDVVSTQHLTNNDALQEVVHKDWIEY